MAYIYIIMQKMLTANNLQINLQNKSEMLKTYLFSRMRARLIGPHGLSIPSILGAIIKIKD